MRCHIYKSLKKDGLYLYVNERNNFSDVPETLYKFIGTPVYVMELELTPQRKLARVDADQVIAQLSDLGYFIQMPPGRVLPGEMMH